MMMRIILKKIPHLAAILWLVLPVALFGVTESELIAQARPMLANPLVPAAIPEAPGENAALQKALAACDGFDFSPVDVFLEDYPQSRYKASLLAGLGIRYKSEGRFTLALATLEEAWQAGIPVSTPHQLRSIAERAGGEWVDLLSKLGRMEDLRSALQGFEGRDIMGSTSELIAGAKEGLWYMDHIPGKSYRCGPLALACILATGDPDDAYDPLIEDYLSPSDGVSLGEVEQLATDLEMGMQAAFRQNLNEPVPIPSVVHWKSDHYAAVVGYADGHYQIQDPTFRLVARISKQALDEEASGFFLIPAGALTAGWRAASQLEKDEFHGRGQTLTKDPDSTTEDDRKEPDNEECKGMAIHSVHSMLVSLNIVDIPLGYVPPRGDAIAFKLTYNEREATEPSVFEWSNVGVKWNCHWMSYVDTNYWDTSGNIAAFPQTILPGGGRESYSALSIPIIGDGQSITGLKSQAKLRKTGPYTFERVLPDGTRQIYDRVAPPYSGERRKTFLTRIVDPSGNETVFTFDASFRITKVRDSIGQETTLRYDHPTEPLLITGVEDPFGRITTVEYDSSLRLTGITDVEGIESVFSYLGSTDKMVSMTTPYGTTSFDRGGIEPNRWLEITDASGDVERVEFLDNAPGIAASEQPGNLPSGMTVRNLFLQFRNTFYWDRKAYAEAAGDYPKARLTHWLHTGLPGSTETSGIVESRKLPFENRTWFQYEGSPKDGNYIPITSYEGDSDQPIHVGKVLDDGSTQLFSYEYNEFGLPTKITDPLQRVTEYQYDTNGLDLLNARQKTGTANDLLVTMTWNSGVAHKPDSVTDAAGETTYFTCNAFGQPLTITNAKNETTTFVYDRDDDSDSKSDGYLLTITGPVAGSVTTFTYDTFGRVETITDSESYTVTMSYDNLDRLTRIDYPDGTYSETTYEAMEPVSFRDRLGRISQREYNHLREQVKEIDPLGRITQYEWCKCGSLKSLTDAMGRKTQWTRDVQGRVTSKIYPDTSHTDFTYEPMSGRLSTVTDARSQTKTHTYFKDNNVQSIVYNGEVETTPDVSYTYDDIYDRLETQTDGTGITQYDYHAVGTLGANQISTIDGPLANDAISYGYDELGRLVNRRINGTANETAIVYDALGRMDSQTNPLGFFNYSYVNHTSRLDHVDLPNNITTEFSYGSLPADPYLNQIRHLDPVQSVISQFDYLRAPTGRIDNWTILQNGVESSLDLHYDRADQLLGASKENSSTQIIDSFSYNYDKAGNRLSSHEGPDVRTWTVNNLNQLTGESPGGWVAVRGSVDERADVAINGKAASLSENLDFEGWTSLVPGTNTITITATDGSDNTVSKDYEFTVNSGSSTSPTYDENGNMTSDGSRSFFWDSEDRLVRIEYADNSSTEFAYDGLSRRVQITERDASSTITADHYFIWDRMSMAEKREAGSGTLVARYFQQGWTEPQSGEEYYYLRDQLDSIREVADDTGAIISTYIYELWGERELISGTDSSEFSYTGHFLHNQSGLVLALFRAYEPGLGRWLSRDPIGEAGGINLYGYVANDPVNGIDPLGLWNLWNPGTWGVSPCEEENPWLPWDTSAHWATSYDSLADTSESIVDAFAIASLGNWDQLAVIAKNNPLGQTEGVPVANNLVRGALTTSALATAGASAIGYANLPPAIQYGILDMILNGIDMTGGNDPVELPPKGPPPIVGPAIPGEEK